MKNMLSVINDTNYDLLWHQKMLLLELRDSTKTTHDQGVMLNGLVHFLDAFQDAVVEDGTLLEQRVFGIGCNEGECDEDI